MPLLAVPTMYARVAAARTQDELKAAAAGAVKPLPVDEDLPGCVSLPPPPVCGCMCLDCECVGVPQFVLVLSFL